MFIEPYKLGKTLIVSATTTAQDVAINGQSFYIQNISADKVIYFKEKLGAVATNSNSISLAAGMGFPYLLTANTLSVLGSGTGNVAIQFME